MNTNTSLGSYAYFLAILLLTAGFGGTTGARGDADDQTVVWIGPAERLAELRIPGDIGENESLPLVVVMHGYYDYPEYIYEYFEGIDSVDANRHLLLTPFGTENPDDYYFWNATPACCDFYDQRPDDVSYLSGLIDIAVEEHGADAQRVMFIGHSNGGFMSHRTACDAGDKIHTIVNFAGSTFDDFADCGLTGYPNILNVHGTDDDVISYDGGSIWGEPYPSAPDSTSYWAERSGCETTATESGTLDLVDGDGENETVQLRHLDCTQGNRVSLWKLVGVDHTPNLPEGSLINAAFDWAFNYVEEREGCTNSSATNYDQNATVDDGSCEFPAPPVPGCMDSSATNYNVNATVDDGSCEYPPPPVPGCMDSNATNYNVNATVDDGSCEYPPPPVPGCMDSNATNYDQNATVDDGSCEYLLSIPDNNTATNETRADDEGTGLPGAGFLTAALFMALAGRWRRRN